MCYRLWVWSLGFSRVYSTSTFDLASRILSAQVHLQLVLYYTYLLVNLLLNILCVLWKYVFSYECCNQTYSYTSKENVSLHFSFINESFRVIAIDFCNNNVVRVNRFANALSVLSSSALSLSLYRFQSLPISFQPVHFVISSIISNLNGLHSAELLSSKLRYIISIEFKPIHIALSQYLQCTWDLLSFNYKCSITSACY